MTTPASFQIETTALLPGVTLIEASAGTGKTFTIAGLFLRLMLEKKLSVDEILVVTYTEAATEELRGRIRQTLADAVTGFTDGSSSNPFLQTLIENHQGPVSGVLARLGQALSNFDEAPIFTIHGFCQRQLQDRAFESGALFDTELITDPSRLLKEIAEDYWRRHFYEAPPLLVRVALKNHWGPERLQSELEIHCRHLSLRTISQVDGRSLADLSEELHRAFQQARELWRTEAAAIRAVFGQAKEWAVDQHANPETIRKQLANLECCFSDAPIPESLNCLSFFSANTIKQGTSKRKKPPVHHLFDLCEKLVGSERDFLTGLRLDLLDFARVELPRRKQRLKIQSFDDLLTRLYQALIGPGGRRLAIEVRAKYKAALIDEFQDTDPVQYQIFRRIFATTKAYGHDPEPPKSVAQDSPLLFLIGDPKQAIYGFRGADFFTYLDAARRADRHFTLDSNWRSEAGLVTAVNTFFTRAAAPFVFDDIQFHPVNAKGEADQKPLHRGGERLAPLHLWFYPRGTDGREISGEKAEAVLPRVVASEIARLLNEDTRLGDKRIGPQDIAVLVLKHKQAALIQEALRALNIPSVLHTEASLFASAEARELSRVLAAIAEPANEHRIRVALTTRLLGVSGTELDALDHQEAQWQARLERFHRYSDLWSERGFTPMMRALLHEEQVRQRLLSFPDGERQLTNVLHLAEAIHQAALERRLGPAGIQQWLSDHLASGDKAAEEYQLRLERDDFAVKLVTIHKSKGLEYPIVFCPFTAKSSDLKWGGEEQIFFHERPEDGDSQFVRDLGSKDYQKHRELAFREKLAENVRLLYVALTRARNRCYLVWGAFNQAATSAPAWLLHSPGIRPGNIQEQMNSHFKLLDDVTIRRHLDQLVRASALGNGGPTILVRDLPVAEAEPYRPVAQKPVALSPRIFTGFIDHDWRATSFSALATQHGSEQPDYDPSLKPPTPQTAPSGTIFAFPRGTKAGTCLHKILETLDFTATDAMTLGQVVREQLRAHGFDEDEFAPALIDCVQRTLLLPLEPQPPRFTLSSVDKAHRLNELEFCFPLKRTSPAVLSKLFTGMDAKPGTSFARLQFDPVRGILQGFIDLMFQFGDRFYLLDWKSNWLGNSIEDYNPAAMRREINDRLYSLQYHLYTLAMHQYLTLRLPGYNYEKHFGGVFYLFLRGIDPARPEFGVFRDRPSAELIQALSDTLLAKLENPPT
jgi:exodeoxyribonuclease V beta subunit